MPVRPERGVIESCLRRAEGARILVVGDVMVDRYLSGSVDRISPEAPVPVVRAGRTRSAPGGAANVAAGVAALGSRVDLVGVAGHDRAGRGLEAALGRRGIGNAGLVTVEDRPTTVKLRVVAEHQQVLRIDREDARPLDERAAARLQEAALEALAGAAVLVLQDYDKGVFSIPLIEALIAEARGTDIPVVVDPKLRHFFAYRGATVFKPNASELATALGEETAPRDPDRLAEVVARIGCRHLLVTMGARGMRLLSEGGSEALHIPSRARDVYDVSGAGDTVTATLAVALAGGASMHDAAWLANLAAGLAVARFGARPVGRQALAREMDRALTGRATEA